MIRVIEDMPEGTVGIEAVGKVTEDDYKNVMIPALSEALERKDARIMYVLGDDFESYAPGAIWQDIKLGTSNMRGWKRIAVVTDADWLENSIKALGWMMPGEIKVFDDDEADEAKAWLVRPDDD
jgi:SpoIIAA-like